jgi:restriction system protein
MKHSSVHDAFEILLAELKTALAEVREGIATASREGRYQEAQTLLVKAQKMEKFIGEVRAKHKEWTHLNSKPSRIAEGRPRPLSPGRRTPQQAYRLPILRALVALGGKARTEQVRERIYREMKARLTSVDLELLPSGRVERWWNTARWERNNMVQEGLLKRDSPYGVWEITEKGEAYLRKYEGESQNPF